LPGQPGGARLPGLACDRDGVVDPCPPEHLTSARARRPTVGQGEALTQAEADADADADADPTCDGGADATADAASDPPADATADTEADPDRDAGGYGGTERRPGCRHNVRRRRRDRRG
jgi:hypothetical protein